MIGKKDIEKLATLARINIADKEIDSLTGEMDSILEYVKQIEEVSGGELGEVSQLSNVMRDDGEPHESGIYTKDILEQAPETEGGYIKVKKIL